MWDPAGGKSLGFGAFWGLSTTAGKATLHTGGHDAVFGVSWVRECCEALHMLGINIEAPK